jgi:polyisoprenyl-teichoic acid--peptidoglycan teichoic acid transferase
MTDAINTTTPPRSRVRGFFNLIFFRFIPALLILSIVWVLVQAAGTLIARYNALNDLNARREAYSTTATAISSAGDTNMQDNPAQESDDILVQFVTNTPSDAVVPTATQPVAATPVPVEAVPTQLPVVESSFNYVAPTIIPPNPQPAVAAIAGTAAPTQVPLIPRNYPLVNILLIGADDEVTQDNTLRTDTLIVVSVNLETRSVAMLSLPRDMFVYIPTPTMTRLNTVYNIGESFGWDGGGFGLLRQTIFYNFGINVHYYAKVNFTGFETIINTLGGVDVAVDCAYEDFYPVDNIDLSRPLEENYYLRKLAVGYYTLNGFDALWYARTRKATTDFDRGKRQQQLLRAIFRKALSSGQLANLPQLWGEFTQVVETNLPFETMLGLLPIALNVSPEDIQNYTLIRTYHTTPWQPTEGPFAGQAVQLPVYEPIRQLLTEFYTPPTSSQINVDKPSIAVFNGTTNADWDKVAAGRLRDEGYNAFAAGAADTAAYADTLLIDQVGSDKDSLNPEVAEVLNIATANVQIAPDVNRQADYRVVVGASYNSCSAEGFAAD